MKKHLDFDFMDIADEDKKILGVAAIVYVVSFLFFYFAGIAIFSFVVGGLMYLLWNYFLMVVFNGPTISFWMFFGAVGIVTLLRRILRKVFGEG